MELLFATASLFAITLAASFIFYRRIKRAQTEYEDAKDILKTITLGLSRQVNRLLGKIDNIGERSEEARITSKDALKMSEQASKIAMEGLKNSKDLAVRLDETDKAIDAVKLEVQKLVKGVKPPAIKDEAVGPISIQEGAILDKLTDTEIEVLTMIDEAGEASVPEIRNRIKKTREHTARLLKKLYERGFIDRNTGGMPYRYHVRKEIRDIVQQRRKNLEIAA